MEYRSIPVTHSAGCQPFIYYPKETFNLINNMEFLNDRYASLALTYDMNGKLFNRIPLIKN